MSQPAVSFLRWEALCHTCKTRTLFLWLWDKDNIAGIYSCTACKTDYMHGRNGGYRKEDGQKASPS
jgi:hypothetical protein